MDVEHSEMPQSSGAEGSLGPYPMPVGFGFLLKGPGT